jgi:hypothetical protein
MLFTRGWFSRSGQAQVQNRKGENSLVLVDGVPASGEIEENRGFVKGRIRTGGDPRLCLAYHFLRMIFSLLSRNGRNAVLADAAAREKEKERERKRTLWYRSERR